MINQIDTALWYKINGLSRYILAHAASGIMPLYIVNEYPKSGGSWIGEMLGEALGVPFPRNRLPMLKPSILHGHMMHSWNMKNVLIVWRDGRDVLVSQYYHALFENEKGNAGLVRKCRADLQFADYERIEDNLVRFIEYVYKEKKQPRMSWADFVDKWSDCEACVHVRYEDIRKNPVIELHRIVKQLGGPEIGVERLGEIVDKYSFERMAGRQAGDENRQSFLRKGIVGDWRSHFTEEASKRFAEYGHSALVKLGYETSGDWIKAHG